ncbi:MAG: hypothetical protein ABSB53_05140 [Nitrososphaerales archaeon]|jgi:hypothetical protein
MSTHPRFGTNTVMLSGSAGFAYPVKGQGVLFGVFTSMASGTTAPTSGTIMVMDACSGVSNQSAAKRFYYFSYVGTASGYLPPDLTGINAPFFSGLAVYSTAVSGVNLTLVWKLGV